MDLEAEVEKIDSVYKSLELSSELFKSEAEFLHQKRLVMDPFIFDTLKKLYGGRFREFWNETNTIPYLSDKAIIIVERRCNPNLEFVLQNFAYFARGYAIHIFCSKANLAFIENICGTHNIHIEPIFDNIGTPEQGKIDYNELLKTKEFWDRFKEEHILTVETDCYLIKPIPDSIYEYDYVASKWSWLPDEPGGGGLSYRKCSVMKKVCELEMPVIPMQDSFASTGVKMLGAKWSHSYFTESVFSADCIGMHQWWTFYSISKSKYNIHHALAF
jgi:hypothetical protein